MKKFLLITTALVALGAAPVFAQSYGKATAGSTTAAVKATPDKAAKKVTATKAKGQKAMVHHASAKAPAMGSRKSLDAKEKPITAQLNKEAQASAGVPGATIAGQPLLQNRQPQMGMTGQQAPAGQPATSPQAGPGASANPNTATQPSR